MTTAALYARVSSEKQVNENTITSQVDALKARIIRDGFTLLEGYQFIDNGYSGSNLVRSALEKLHDQVAFGTINKIYIHSPDYAPGFRWSRIAGPAVDWLTAIHNFSILLGNKGAFHK